MSATCEKCLGSRHENRQYIDNPAIVRSVLISDIGKEVVQIDIIRLSTGHMDILNLPESMKSDDLHKVALKISEVSEKWFTYRSASSFLDKEEFCYNTRSYALLSDVEAYVKSGGVISSESLMCSHCAEKEEWSKMFSPEKPRK